MLPFWERQSLHLNYFSSRGFGLGKGIHYESKCRHMENLGNKDPGR
jgi:hypothetical protein